jgi:hypothetical protein
MAAGCYDSTGIVSFKIAQTAVVKQSVCTAAQVSGFLNACVLMGATDTACKAWTGDMNNAACQSCMLGDAMSTSPPALVEFTTLDMNGLIYDNRAACEALVEMKPECGGPLTSAVLCDESACQGCMDNTAFDACVKSAEADACKDVLMAVSAECQMVGAKGYDPKCDGKDFQSIAVNVVATMCGTGN